MASADHMHTDINFVPHPPRPDIYHLEFNYVEDTARLPYVFCKKYFDTVPTKVVLTDPVGNELNVGIAKIGNRAFFADGWSKIGAFYGLEVGGWIEMSYSSLGNFTVHKVTTLLGDQITYPTVTVPPVVNDYRNPILLDDDDDNLNKQQSSTFLVDRSKLITAVIKCLSFDEVTGNNLAFSNSWCQYALPKKDGDVTLIDEYGKAWLCYYKVGRGDSQVSGIVRGWKKFCRDKKLYQGQGAKFGVICPNSNVLYFTPAG